MMIFPAVATKQIQGNFLRSNGKISPRCSYIGLGLVWSSNYLFICSGQALNKNTFHLGTLSLARAECEFVGTNFDSFGGWELVSRMFVISVSVSRENPLDFYGMKVVPSRRKTWLAGKIHHE